MGMALPRKEPMLTVAAMIERLKDFPSDAILVQSQDAEGNGFSPVSELSVGYYLEETTWHGEFTDHEDDEEGLREHGAAQAVCIWPIN
jgi:hypothetical protein